MIGTPEFKVGALVVIVSGLIGIMSLKVTEGPGLFSKEKTFWFEVDDAAGLVKNSAVKVAGIDVGIIEDIKLEKGRARIYVTLNDDVVVPTDSSVEIRAAGILGDRYVEVVPGAASEKLMDGQQILTAKQRGSLDNLVTEIGKITDSVRELADNLNKAAIGDKSTSVGRIIQNLEVLTEDLSDVTSANKDKMNRIMTQVDNITSTLDNFINDESPDGFKEGWKKATASLHRLDNIMRDVEEITDKVNSGEGTIGRLINDEETVDGINTAIENVNDFLGGAGTMQTSIDFHSEYLSEVDEAKSFLNVRIQPGLDRYYEIGVVDDPRGLVRETRIETTGTVNTDFTETKTFRNKLKFNALFAKNFYDLTIKGGLIESSGGVGIDYFLFRRRLRFSVEAFNFQDTNVRAFARYYLTQGIYLVGGGDNITDDELNSSFVGAGVFITNDDLKTLASRIAF